MDALTPGTRVTLDDPDTGAWHGRVVVCLCKRHVWQPALEGRECGHARGFRVDSASCPWPVHVVWDSHWADIDGPNESHQSADDLTSD